MEIQRYGNRIGMQDEEGREVAYVVLRSLGTDRVEIVSTVVDEALRGQGLAGKLLEGVAGELRRSGEKAVPVCSYAVAWFARHPEQGDLLAQGDGE